MTNSQLPHAVIVGGTSGIGLATASRLLADGYRVTIAGRDKARLAAALGQLSGTTAAGAGGATAGTGGTATGTGGTATGTGGTAAGGTGRTGEADAAVSGEAVDAADGAAVRAFFTGLGPLDHLVVTVTAPAGLAPAAGLAADRLRDAFEGKLLAHLNCVQAALPSLREDGSVVLVSAASARGGLPGTTGLAAVNGAVEAMIRPLAVELAPRRVNAVSPGIIDTAWWGWLPDEARQAAFAQAAASTPVGRVGRAEDVADAIAFLIGNAFTTGVVLPCDGGALLPAG